MTNTNDLIDSIQATINELSESHQYVGVRTSDDEMDCSDLSQRSHLWIDGDRTDDELDGICATDASGNWVDMHVTKQGHHYFGDHIYIIAGDRASYGVDDDELVITPAIIINAK